MKELFVLHAVKPVIVDAEDFDRLSKFSWRQDARSKNIQSSIRDGDRLLMFSLASEVMHNRGQMFDHIDRNPNNNQKSNLRICNYSDNARNTAKRKGHTSSKYKGVHFNKQIAKWQASIRVNYRGIHLGLFKNELDAALAYNKAAKKYFGEFACLNTI